MEHHEKRSKWKTITIWITVSTFALTFIGCIVTTVWAVAQINSRIDQSDAFWKDINEFRIEAVKATATQKELNRQLMEQAIEFKTRLNRLDGIHKLPPLQ